MKKLIAVILVMSMTFVSAIPSSAATKKATAIYPCIMLEAGGEITISGFINPTDSSETVSYSTSNKKILTVTSKGKIKAIAKGTAYIKLKTSDSKKSSRLYVKVTSKKASETSTVFSPKDVSDKTIKSIKTYSDYLIMFQKIIEDYLANYEKAIKDTVLYNKDSFARMKQQYDEAFEAQKKRYESYGDKKLVGKDTLVEFLISYRDSLKESTDRIAKMLS